MERAHEISVNWPQILMSIREDFALSEISYNTWLKPLIIHQTDEKAHVVSIVVPVGDMGVTYIRNKYGYALKAAISEYAGREYHIRLITPEEAAEQDDAQKRQDQLRQQARKGCATELNEDFTFDRFVVGSHNRFACAAAMNVAGMPGETACNPLYLYSGAGLGKTHLMQAIGHRIAEEHPELKVLYVSAEAFANELITAIRSGHDNASRIEQFREKYRSADVFLIDDIQFLIGKEATQQEFFHTFNILFDAHKQIVLSSDRPPKELTALDERYSSRCAMGLQADIGTPDYETRMAILDLYNEQSGGRISQDILQYIAEHITDNIRYLIGAFKKVQAMVRLTREEMTLQKAKDCLRDSIAADQTGGTVTADVIVETVAEHFGIRTEDIQSKKKKRVFVYARHLATYLAREMTALTLGEIGEKTGGRDHSSVTNSLAKVDGKIRTSPETRQTLDVLKKKIGIAV